MFLGNLKDSSGFKFTLFQDIILSVLNPDQMLISGEWSYSLIKASQLILLKPEAFPVFSRESAKFVP